MMKRTKCRTSAATIFAAAAFALAAGCGKPQPPAVSLEQAAVQGNIPAIRHVLQDKRTDVLTIGMRLPAEIDANLAILSGDPTYTAQDRALLAAYSAKLYDTDAIQRMRIE